MPIFEAEHRLRRWGAWALLMVGLLGLTAACLVLLSFIAMGVISLLWVVVGFDFAFGDSLGAPLAHWTWHPDGFLRKWGVLDFPGAVQGKFETRIRPRPRRADRRAPRAPVLR